MKLFLNLLLLASAILCCGFTIVTEEMIKEREELCTRIISTYGDQKLNAFILSTIEEVKEIEGIKLDQSVLGEKWEAMDWNPFWHIASGEWAIEVNVEEFNRFTCLWMPDKIQGVMIKGIRKESGELVRERVWVEEMVELNWR